MKKLLSILCVSIIALTAASCKKETIVQGNTNTTKFFTVNTSDWDLVPDGGGSYVVDLTIPALDAQYSDKGAVLVYIAPPNSTEWEQIPEVFNGRAFSFTHDVGRVSIFSQNPSGTGTPTAPQNLQVKVVMIDSNAD